MELQQNRLEGTFYGFLFLAMQSNFPQNVSLLFFLFSQAESAPELHSLGSNANSVILLLGDLVQITKCSYALVSFFREIIPIIETCESLMNQQYQCPPTSLVSMLSNAMINSQFPSHLISTIQHSLSPSLPETFFSWLARFFAVLVFLLLHCSSQSSPHLSNPEMLECPRAQSLVFFSSLQCLDSFMIPSRFKTSQISIWWLLLNLQLQLECHSYPFPCPQLTCISLVGNSLGVSN